MTPPGRFGTIQSAPPPTPRLRAARALADAVVEALEGGDVAGARAAAAALYEFTSRLALTEEAHDSAVGELERMGA